MKPALFGIGLGMFLCLGACAAPYGEDSEPREESVKSATSEEALDALRSRVQQDFASAPAMQGHTIVFAVDKIDGDTQRIAIHAHMTKRTGDGKELDLTDADFLGAVGSDTPIHAPQHAEVSAILVKHNGSWSTLKNGILGTKAVEAYVVGQSTEAFEGWAQDFGVSRSDTERTHLGH